MKTSTGRASKGIMKGSLLDHSVESFSRKCGQLLSVHDVSISSHMPEVHLTKQIAARRKSEQAEISGLQ